MFQDSKESRLPSLLSYSVVKEPTTFDRVGSVLRATPGFSRFALTADPASGSSTTCRNPLLFQPLTAPSDYSVAFMFVMRRDRVITATVPPLFQRPRLLPVRLALSPARTRDNRIRPLTFHE